MGSRKADFVGTMKSLSISQLSLGLSLLLWCGHVSADTLVIEKVTCQRVATGIDNFAKAGAEAIGALIAGGITAVGGVGVILGTGGTGAPVTAGAVASAAVSGGKAGQKALDFLNSKTSGTDDLIININGEHVWPVGEKHGSIKAGESITPNIEFDFDGYARIQLIEYDWGSDNDNLGSLDVNPDVMEVAPEDNYRIDDAIVLNKDEGDLYYVTYHVTKNDKGKSIPKWMICGTAACKECESDCCESDSNQGLDRDGDMPDLRTCPPGFTDKGRITYDLWWPADDVYLRICGNEYTPSDSCDRKVVVNGYLKMMRELAANQENSLMKTDKKKRQNALRELAANRKNSLMKTDKKMRELAANRKNSLMKTDKKKRQNTLRQALNRLRNLED